MWTVNYLKVIETALQHYRFLRKYLHRVFPDSDIFNSHIGTCIVCRPQRICWNELSCDNWNWKPLSHILCAEEDPTTAYHAEHYFLKQLPSSQHVWPLSNRNIYSTFTCVICRKHTARTCVALGMNATIFRWYMARPLPFAFADGMHT